MPVESGKAEARLGKAVNRRRAGAGWGATRTTGKVNLLARLGWAGVGAKNEHEIVDGSRGQVTRSVVDAFRPAGSFLLL
jgi:hypothetical protein